MSDADTKAVQPAPSNRLLPDDWQEKFLETYALHGNVTFAATVAGVGRSTVYDYRSKDKEFARRFEDAKQTAIQELYMAARQRALSGSGGNPPSDRLLIFLLSSLAPEQFGYKTGEKDKQAQAQQVIVQVNLPENHRDKVEFAVQQEIDNYQATIDAEFDDVIDEDYAREG